jgi:hypothetical protein
MSNGTTPTAGPPKLPVIGTIVAAYRFVFRHFRPLALAAVVPFAVALITDLRWLWAAREQSMTVSAQLVWMLLPFVATIPLAAQCQRYFLDAAPANRPRLGFPWSRRETAFLLHSLGLFGLMLVLNAIIIPMVAGLAPNESALGIVLAALAFVLTVYIIARFTLVLPAAAVGRRMSWGEAWRRAADHAVGLALIIVLAPLPWLVPSAIQMIAGPKAAQFWPYLATTAAIEACGLISTVTVLVALAAAYRWITGDTNIVSSTGGA